MSETENKPSMMTMKEVAYMASQIGFSVAITTVLFVAGGKYLDVKTGESPIFTLLGIVLGLAGSMYLVWQIVKPLIKKHKPDFSALSRKNSK